MLSKGHRTTSQTSTPPTRPSRPGRGRGAHRPAGDPRFLQSVEFNAETELETLRIPGHEAAFHWYLTFSGTRISIVSVMMFNDEGKIAAMKAYWGQDNIAKA